MTSVKPSKYIIVWSGMDAIVLHSLHQNSEETEIKLLKAVAWYSDTRYKMQLFIYGLLLSFLCK